MSLIKNGEIIPYFQPILSIEDKCVFGYETLGRLKLQNGEIISLGNFFTAKFYSWLEYKGICQQVASDYKAIDNLLQFKSLEKIKNDPNKKSKLFINVSPSLLEDNSHGDEYFSNLIDSIEKVGLSPDRIVIEITEEYIRTGLKPLRPKIEYLKSLGCLIAIDDLGTKSSNLDRIGFFQPDIIKIDMQILKMSVVDRNYEQILYTIAQLSESIGISVLYEGIETEEELFHAMSFGSRYIQGYLFEKAQPNLIKREYFYHTTNRLLAKFYIQTTDALRARVSWENEIENKLNSLNLKDLKLNNYMNYASSYEEIFKIDRNIYRFFITDIYGNQVSPNYIRGLNNEILIDYGNPGNNWSWRPYFLNHIYRTYRIPSRWVISKPYRDILKNLILRTFSLSLDDNLIIFIDLIYKESKII
ncbi:MAG: EAL domain-containing protein [Leptospiraceae bacterium]|nr:EAL domain-containing protein [Leptospiraceae bacterium]MCP5493078.1 EAL domain-containing protein [Leptospiraceae bacterium]